MIIRIVETKCKCDQCGHEWNPKGERLPVLCANPKCHSYNWNKSSRIHDLTKIEDGYADEEDLKEFEKNYGVTVGQIYKN